MTMNSNFLFRMNINNVTINSKLLFGKNMSNNRMISNCSIVKKTNHKSPMFVNNTNNIRMISTGNNMNSSLFSPIVYMESKLLSIQGRNMSIKTAGGHSDKEYHQNIGLTLDKLVEYTDEFINKNNLDSEIDVKTSVRNSNLCFNSYQL